MAASQTTPGASGKVDIQKNKNGNTQVQIHVEHLAQPGMLTPPASNYVIWFQEERGQPVNAGQIRVGKDLKGDYRTTTPFQNFRIFVTAEADPLAKEPTGPTVLSTNAQV